MYSDYATIVSWFVFWLTTVVIVKLDDKRAKAKAKAAGTQDFADRRIRSYVLAAFLLGGLVLVLYFWSTRRSKKGGLVGVAALGVAVLVTMVVSSLYGAAALSLDDSAGRRACATLSPEDPDGEKCTQHAARAGERRADLLAAGCAAGQVGSCLNLDEASFGSGLFGSSEPQPESDVRRRARELCESRSSTAPRGRCAVFDVASSPSP